MSEYDVIDNTSNFIDSREIDARIECLEGFEGDGGQFDPDEADELEALRELRDDLKDYSPDWQYGSQLINDRYMKTYVQNYVDEMGGEQIASFIHVDWEGTVRDFLMDYTSSEFNGVTFWVK